MTAVANEEDRQEAAEDAADDAELRELLTRVHRT